MCFSQYLKKKIRGIVVSYISNLIVIHVVMVIILIIADIIYNALLIMYSKYFTIHDWIHMVEYSLIIVRYS